MSRKRHRRRKHPGKRIVRAAASAPGTVRPGNPGAEHEGASVLAAIATALEAAEKSGIRPRLRHDAVLTEAGYVLRIGGQWVVRTRLLTEFPAASGGSDGKD